MRGRGAARIGGGVAAIVMAGCSGRQSQADRERQSFDCGDRLATYVAKKPFGASERGVALDCEEAGPRLKRWLVTDEGTRAEEARGMTPGEFDALWKKVDGVGWRDLKDCPTGDDKEPIFTFSFRDWTGKNGFTCQALRPPYPYYTIVDELDMAAHKGRPQLAPDEPAPDEAGSGARPAPPPPRKKKR